MIQAEVRRLARALRTRPGRAERRWEATDLGVRCVPAETLTSAAMDEIRRQRGLRTTELG